MKPNILRGCFKVSIRTGLKEGMDAAMNKIAATTEATEIKVFFLTLNTSLMNAKLTSPLPA